MAHTNYLFKVLLNSYSLPVAQGSKATEVCFTNWLLQGSRDGASRVMEQEPKQSFAVLLCKLFTVQSYKKHVCLSRWQNPGVAPSGFSPSIITSAPQVSSYPACVSPLCTTGVPEMACLLPDQPGEVSAGSQQHPQALSPPGSLFVAPG